MKSYVAKNKTVIISAVFLVGMLCLLFSWNASAHKGQHLRGDETFSYGLANNAEEYLFVGPWMLEDHWTSTSLLKNYMSVQKGQAFNYKMVWKHQADDVHPPLYYVLIHTVSSFFIDSYSNAIGYFINFIFMLGILSIVYLIEMKYLFKNEKLYSLLGCFLLIFTAGILEIICVIRMYTMLIFFVLLTTYILMRILDHKGIGKKEVALLFGTSLCGALTHYFYYMFAFFPALFALVYMISKKWSAKDVLKYIFTWIGGISSALLVFPYTINHVLNTNRGIEIQESFAGGWDNFTSLFKSLDYYVFYGYTVKFAIVLAVAILIAIWKRYSRKNAPSEKISMKDCFDKNRMMIFSEIVALFVVMKSSSSGIKIAYISPGFPFLILFYLIIVYDLFRYAFHKRAAEIFVFVWLAVIVIPNGVKDYFYTAYQKQEQDTMLDERIEEMGKADCFAVYPAGSINTILDGEFDCMTNFDEIYVCDQNAISVEKFEEEIKNRVTKDAVVIYDREKYLVDCLEKEQLEALGKNYYLYRK